jgi:hypothetical protein
MGSYYTSPKGNCPMNRDDFIIATYCLIADELARIEAEQPQKRLRKAGFPPKLSDAEVITLEICGEFFKLHTDADIFSYFATHYRAFFPHLGDRTVFVRQAVNLHQVKQVIWQHLVQKSGQDRASLQVIDTLPFPVGGFTRRFRLKCFRGVADVGYCAAKKMTYYGFKIGLRVSSLGMITHCPLLDARSHDVNHIEELLEAVSGMIAADKGFIDTDHQSLLAQQGTDLVTPLRSNSKQPSPYPAKVLAQCAYFRKKVETVGSQLCDRFGLHRLRVRSLWHLCHRLGRKVLSHTVAVWFNLQQGKPPLNFESLVTP